MGVDILSPVFGTLYPSSYCEACKDFGYGCQLESQAHIPRDQGNIYYLGAFFRVLVVEVH